jgi:hypothetical protein
MQIHNDFFVIYFDFLTYYEINFYLFMRFHLFTLYTIVIKISTQKNTYRFYRLNVRFIKRVEIIIMNQLIISIYLLKYRG